MQRLVGDVLMQPLLNRITAESQLRIDTCKTAQPPIILFRHSIIKLHVRIIRHGLRKRPPKRPVYRLRHEFPERFVLRWEVPRTFWLMEKVDYGRRMATSQHRSQVLHVSTRLPIRYYSVVVDQQDFPAPDSRVQPLRDFVDGNIVHALSNGLTDACRSRPLFLPLYLTDGIAKML